MRQWQQVAQAVLNPARPAGLHELHVHAYALQVGDAAEQDVVCIYGRLYAIARRWARA
jgi:hypothetical protein